MTTTIRTDQFPSKSGHWSLYAGGIAAILASTCHHISFLLVMLGLSSTKIIYSHACWLGPSFSYYRGNSCAIYLLSIYLACFFRLQIQKCRDNITSQYSW